MTDPSTEREAIQHWPRVFGFAVSLTRDRTQAEDLCQEAYLRLLNRPADLDRTRSVLPFLLTIVRNLFISEARRRRPVRLEATGDASGRDVEPVDERAEDPEVAAIRREESDGLHAALEQLPESWRAALYLKDGLGLSYREIGDVIDASTDTVRTMLHRARQRLRRALPGRRMS
ncbi:MAG: sigma-70 family RNA polymerase sigma factor [Planctomycetes bacterium]|nr:sigma-70 family RNA polymerase sigma factor [Planctomycetota bacterium]